MRRPALSALAAVLVLNGCSSSPDRQRTPLPLFPEATEVRVFGGVDFIHQGAGGAVVGTKLENGKLRNDAPAVDGGVLTAEEIALLRRSVDTGPEPKSAKLCCTPRHAFLFFDRNHRQIGYLEVCFQCGCARIYLPPGSLHSFADLGWDHEALTRIVEAHRLPPLPKED